MAIDFSYQSNPTATNGDKNVHTKVVKLAATDFVTGGVASVKAVLPADSTILSMSYWKKTALSGGGITAATLSIGVSGAATQFVNAYDVHTPAAGAYAVVTPITNIIQNYALPLGADISLLFTGTATTGNPTAGEIYIVIEYVR
jgi:hypothetical protein